MIRRSRLWLTAFAALMFLAGLGARDLWNPNEPTYGLAVAEMAERGDWLVPTVGGRVFPEKPILYFWMARLGALALRGVDEWSLRLPLALLGIVSVLMVRELVITLAGRRRADLAALLYATVFMVWWGARSVQMDFLVNVSTLAVALAVVGMAAGRFGPWAGWLAAGLAAGLGFAAKGPVAVLLPALVLLPWLAIDGRLGLLRSRAVLAGAAVFAAAAAPWFVALLATGHGDLVREVLYRQNFVRYVDAWDHREPLWYYLYYFWIDMAPWAWFVPLAAGLHELDRGARRLNHLAWIWIVAVVLFFSLSQSKRSAYMLPIAPAVAVLAAGVAERWLAGGLPRWRAAAGRIVLGVAALGMGGAAWFVLTRALPSYPAMALEARALSLLLVAAAAAIAIGLARGSRVAPPAAFFTFVVVLYLLAGTVVLPAVDRYKSPRGFAERVARTVGPQEPLAIYGAWRWRAGYDFYSGRRIERLETPDALRRYWTRTDRRAWLIVEGPALADARRVIGDAPVVIDARVGGGEVSLLVNRDRVSHVDPARGRPARPPGALSNSRSALPADSGA